MIRILVLFLFLSGCAYMQPFVSNEFVEGGRDGGEGNTIAVDAAPEVATASITTDDKKDSKKSKSKCKGRKGKRGRRR